jgi:hypothetical protein
MMKLTTWVLDKYDDVRFWWDNKPIKRLWRGTRDRFDAAMFCILLLVVGIYSPRALRQIMIDALKDSK